MSFFQGINETYFDTMKRLITVLFALIFLLGCTPQKRLNRLLKRHPYLATTKYVSRIDTFIIPGQKGDSTFKLKKTKKSILINSVLDLIYDENGRLVRDTVEFSGSNYKGKAIVAENGRISFSFEGYYEALAKDTIFLKGKAKNGFTTRAIIDDDSIKLDTELPEDSSFKETEIPVQEVKSGNRFCDSGLFLVIQILVSFLIGYVTGRFVIRR